MIGTDSSFTALMCSRTTDSPGLGRLKRAPDHSLMKAEVHPLLKRVASLHDSPASEAAPSPFRKRVTFPACAADTPVCNWLLLRE